MTNSGWGNDQYGPGGSSRRDDQGGDYPQQDRYDDPPRYGERVPTEGAPYGQQGDQYGQQGSSYGQQTGQYGQQVDPYGQQANTYAQQQGGLPAYGAAGDYDPNNPYAAGVPGSESAPLARPGTITGAMIMSFLYGGLLALTGIILLIAGIAAPDAMADALETVLPGLMVDPSGLSAIFIVGGILALAFGALTIWSAINLGKGKGWARIVLTVIAAFAVLGGLADLASGAFSSVLGLLLAILVIVLMWLPQSSAFIRGRRAGRDW